VCKFLRPTNSIKLYRGFPRFYRKCRAGMQTSLCILCFSSSPPNKNLKVPPSYLLKKTPVYWNSLTNKELKIRPKYSTSFPDACSNNLLPFIRFPSFTTFYQLTRTRRTSEQCMGILRAANFRFSLIINGVSVTSSCSFVYFLSLFFFFTSVVLSLFKRTKNCM
jgi:hypothetical protein